MTDNRPDCDNTRACGSKKTKKYNIRWLLVLYDFLYFLFVAAIMLVIYTEKWQPDAGTMAIHAVLTALCCFGARFAVNIYSQIWRYGGIQSFIRMLISDASGFAVYTLLTFIIPIDRLSFARSLALFCLNLLGALGMRMAYRYAYKCSLKTPIGRFLSSAIRILTGRRVNPAHSGEKQRIKIAIVGAGRVGVGLAEELLANSAAAYIPRCFIDVKNEKIGRQIHGIPVLSEDNATFALLREYEVQEIVFAIPSMCTEEKNRLYDYYRQSGCRIKIYDYPIMQTAGSRRALREFDIEELLLRQPVRLETAETKSRYGGKVVMVTGGGGSIGSELCRQIAAMGPERLIVLDVCENGAYDVQQELKIAWGSKLDVRVEIISVCNAAALEAVFSEYRPDIILHAAAHKHVPLMEHNCREAVENNVFGTLNTVRLADKYGAERFIMVSTDKAVNPTNVMGATKRMCELIVGGYAASGSKTVYSAVRFGNVLGSAGSVIPLFRRQIAAGGPVTVTDKRIIRYFMTIPEASGLVLQAGAMAKSGELFVLDMGKPVKILELAENMIRMSGYEPYTDINIEEIGLRPGEKLYEELLISGETLGKTENSMIFTEKDKPLSPTELKARLEILRDAVKSLDDGKVREALHIAVPTYKTPEEVNADACSAKEMKEASVV